MANLKSVARIIKNGNPSIIKTLYVNFKALPRKQAVKFPIIVSRNARIRGLKKGSIELITDDSLKTAMVLIGFGGSQNLIHYNYKRTCIDFLENGKIIFRGTAQFASHCSIYISASTIDVGDGFSCNNSCSFSSVAGISIGKNCLIGSNVCIRDSDGHDIYFYNPEKQRINNDKPVIIEDHVWVCNNVSILKGVTIGHDCIIGYGTLLTKTIKANNCIVAGNPPQVIKECIEWKK